VQRLGVDALLLQAAAQLFAERVVAHGAGKGHAGPQAR